MEPPEFLLALVGIFGGTAFLLSPAFIVKTVLQHRERMASMKYGVEGSPALQEEIRRLRQEVAELRETTTRFDMSFDAGLARVEDRLGVVEQEQSRTRYTAPSSVDTIEIGRR
ncbi:MAG: hypothetical protein SFU56_05650 [Capsulimonadales bacterium]|nr:hypothetical protein [Capsulimonadales bacterium]